MLCADLAPSIRNEGDPSTSQVINMASKMPVRKPELINVIESADKF